MLDHAIDWGDWLDEGETITEVPTVVPSPAGLTIADIDEVLGLVTWRVSGGDLGQDYIVTCRITTSAGRIDERSLRYRVRER